MRKLLKKMVEHTAPDLEPRGLSRVQIQALLLPSHVILSKPQCVWTED